MPYTIRPATTADGAACTAIYAPYIETAVTFESPAPDAAELSRRIADTLRGYPWLVCERDGEVLGYAYAHRYRPRAAFDWTSEFSIYMSQTKRGHGAGAALYNAVAELMTAQGYIVAYGLVSTPNEPSERLHEKCGFKRMFTLENCAWKLGEWRDLTYYMRSLAPMSDAPAPVRAFPELEAGFVRSVCEKYAAQIREVRT